jgi:hypothetical protein
MTPAGLRAKLNSEPTYTVKLAISEDILTDMRSRLWDNLSWSDEDKEKRMRYLGCKWGFELGARVGECTSMLSYDRQKGRRVDKLATGKRAS